MVASAAASAARLLSEWSAENAARIAVIPSSPSALGDLHRPLARDATVPHDTSRTAPWMPLLGTSAGIGPREALWGGLAPGVLEELGQQRLVDPIEPDVDPAVPSDVGRLREGLLVEGEE